MKSYLRACFDFISKSFYPAFLNLFSVFLPVPIRHIARYAKERTGKNPQKHPLEKCRNKIKTASKKKKKSPKQAAPGISLLRNNRSYAFTRPT